MHIKGRVSGVKQEHMNYTPELSKQDLSRINIYGIERKNAVIINVILQSRMEETL
jgi:hypothetical protein